MFCRLLVKVAENLSTGMLATSLLVVHDTVGSGQHHESELTGREQVVDPLLNILDLDVEARADDLFAGQ